MRWINGCIDVSRRTAVRRIGEFGAGAALALGLGERPAHAAWPERSG